jgi:TolB-like protein/Tfp pilus assembly protein PilF
MGSLIPGYEYDIFISYRQKDNKHDGWVTEFVNQLKGELESTFKEDISLYFDINPHDGLLETHDVDASLKDKLRCLIFIPIISRTYCDPKSFAWEHEFRAFIEQASKDQFGLKVKLPNGNVATRILPVQINDLHAEDKASLEKELGGVLRAIEFIYKEPGVNRPLTGKDNEEKNANKTNYRNQINKVANAVDEVIYGLKRLQIVSDDSKVQSDHQMTTFKEEVRLKGKSVIPGTGKKRNKWLIAGVVAVLFIGLIFGILKVIKIKKQAVEITGLEKSIVVLPFMNDSPDQENAYFINGIMDEILNNLQKIKEFRVLSRTSSEQYRDANRPTIPEIAKKLDVNYIVEGSGQKYGNMFRLRVQLIAANNEKHLWGESFEQEIKETKDIFKIQSLIAQKIAAELKTTITPDEKQLIEKTSTTNLTAYDFFQLGEEEIRKYRSDRNNRLALEKAQKQYDKAIKYDSTFAKAYIGLANVYSDKNYYETYYKENFLDTVLILANRALSYDKQLADAYYTKAKYFFNNGEIEQAIIEIDKAIIYNPNYWEAYLWKATNILLFTSINADYVKAIEYYIKAISLNRGKELPSLINRLGWVFDDVLNFPEKARFYYGEAFKLDKDSIKYFGNLGSIEINNGNLEAAIGLREKSYALDTNNINTVYQLAMTYLYNDQYKKESLRYFRKYIEMRESLGQSPQGFEAQIGYAYWANGLKDKANYWFNESKKLGEESIRLGRSYANYPWTYLNFAFVYAFTGEKERAYEMLSITIRNNKVFPYWIILDIKTNPLFKYIRGEPQFQQIIKDMESKYQAEHERVRKWLEENNML